MNIELLNKKMDKYFKEVTAKQLMQEFKKLGYTFIKIKAKNI